MFPVDDKAASPPARYCPDCNIEMTLLHHGRFSTRYVCPDCDATVTVPPKLTPFISCQGVTHSTSDDDDA